MRRPLLPSVDFKLESLTGLVSAVTAISLFGAVAFAAGFLNYFGFNWIAFLTVNDVLTLTWTLVPPATIAVLATALLTPPEMLRRLIGSAPATPHAKADPTWRRRTLPVLLVLTVGLLLWGVMHRPTTPLLPWGLGLLVDGAAVVGFVLARDQDLRARRWLPALALITLNTCYAAGLGMGALEMNETPKNVLELTNDPARLAHPAQVDGTPTPSGPNEISGRCVSVIHAGERGFIIYRRAVDETTFIPADRVANFSKRRRECGGKIKDYGPLLNHIWRAD